MIPSSLRTEPPLLQRHSKNPHPQPRLSVLETSTSSGSPVDQRHPRQSRSWCAIWHCYSNDAQLCQMPMPSAFGWQEKFHSPLPDGSRPRGRQGQPVAAAETRLASAYIRTAVQKSGAAQFSESPRVEWSAGRRGPWCLQSSLAASRRSPSPRSPRVLEPDIPETRQPSLMQPRATAHHQFLPGSPRAVNADDRWTARHRNADRWLDRLKLFRRPRHCHAQGGIPLHRTRPHSVAARVEALPCSPPAWRAIGPQRAETSHHKSVLRSELGEGDARGLADKWDGA